VKPGPVLVSAALGWLLLGMAGFFSDYVSLIWFFTGLTLLPFIAADALALFFLGDRFSVKRDIPAALAQGESVRVKLEIRREGRGYLPFRIRLWDLYPESMETEVFPVLLDRKLLRSGGELFFEYTLLPRERGQWVIGGTEFLLSSFCGFWRLKVFNPCESRGRIYPDFKKIKTKAGTDLKGLMERSGIKNIRKRGQGLEFNSLRDYQECDSIRAVDWRATSRRRKVIIKEYQEEQDQHLLFLLDSGYRLHRQDDTAGCLQFDSALEAVLLLSWMSLKHGDSVSVGAFGPDTRWLGPRKGMSSFPFLMNSLYDLSSGPQPSSPFSALEDAMEKLKRRTFIILISNFREEDGESLSWILKRLEKRHLLLLVSLREKESEYLASRQPSGSEEALESAAAFSYLAQRRGLYSKWEHSGLLTMEETPDRLSAALINRYLLVKRSGRL